MDYCEKCGCQLEREEERVGGICDECYEKLYEKELEREVESQLAYEDYGIPQ